MHIITRKRLNDFARHHPDTRTALEHWYRNMKRRNFASLAEVRTVFPTADKEEHSVILTAQRQPFYKREKRNPSPIAKDFRWA
jgi:mRNA-degrading endonuclease HigB of HigAB toxin-antitoxin module